MARRSAWLAAALAVGALAPATVASAQPKDLQVAIYAPWAGPSSADARFAFTLEIERAIEQAGLGAAKVSSYAKLVDFRRALTSAQLDVVLVDASAVPLLGKRWVVVASWSSGDSWVLAATAEIRDLRNKRLALQANDAASSKQHIERLLRGQASEGYWARIIGAPVTEDARQLVVRGLADLVAVPKRSATGMTVVIDLGRFTELSLATANGKAALARPSEIVQAAVRDELGGSWAKGAPVLPAAVGATRLVAAIPAAVTTTILDLLAPVDSPPPDLANDGDDLWIEPNAP